MSTSTNWTRLDRFFVDSEEFVAEVQESAQGYRVRVAHNDISWVEDGREWTTLEEAKGRALQLADEMIEQSLK